MCQCIAAKSLIWIEIFWINNLSQCQSEMRGDVFALSSSHSLLSIPRTFIIYNNIVRRWHAHAHAHEPIYNRLISCVRHRTVCHTHWQLYINPMPTKKNIINHTRNRIKINFHRLCCLWQTHTKMETKREMFSIQHTTLHTYTSYIHHLRLRREFRRTPHKSKLL